jgi:hypothetical protein
MNAKTTFFFFSQTFFRDPSAKTILDSVEVSVPVVFFSRMKGNIFTCSCDFFIITF